jgi:intein/homing endonuclease
LRRITNSPNIDSSNNKITNIRHVNNIQYGYICCTGDTNVLLSNNVIKKIKDIDINDEVITINPYTLKNNKSKLKNIIKIDKNDVMKYCKSDSLYEIKTISGRIIKTTGDHPLLVKNCDNNKYEWIFSSNLKINDKLIINHSLSYIDNDNDNDDNNMNYNLIFHSNDIHEKYIDELNGLRLLDIKLSPQQKIILARLLGICSTSDNIYVDHNNSYNC